MPAISIVVPGYNEATLLPRLPDTIDAARNGGARVATAPTLCFVDADMQIHPDTFNAIARAMAEPRFVGGATGVTMERWSLGIAITFAAILPLVWLMNMDTGVVFMRRADFRSGLRRLGAKLLHYGGPRDVT